MSILSENYRGTFLKTINISDEQYEKLRRFREATIILRNTTIENTQFIKNTLSKEEILVKLKKEHLCMKDIDDEFDK